MKSLNSQETTKRLNLNEVRGKIDENYARICSSSEYCIDARIRSIFRACKYLERFPAGGQFPATTIPSGVAERKSGLLWLRNRECSTANS